MRIHPDLVDWEDLTDEVREEDRRLVKRWPKILARADLQIIRPGTPD